MQRYTENKFADAILYAYVVDTNINIKRCIAANSQFRT